MLTLSNEELLSLLLFGGLAHVILLIGCLRWHPLAILAAAFLIVAPFTTALEAKAIIAQLKWGRVYISCLMTAIGFIMVLNRSRFGKSTWGFFIFWALLTTASAWAIHRWEAFTYKVMSATTFLGGIFLALSLKDLRQLRQTIRLMAIPSVIWALLLLWEAATTPGKIGRLDAFGMNPNLIGGLAALCFCLPAALALHLQGKMRVFWAVVAAAHVIIVLMTGSRASFGALVISAGCLFLPLLRRPVVAGIWMGLFAIALTVMLTFITPESASRMLDTANTRMGVWSRVFNGILDSPLYGNGSYLDDLPRLGRITWGNAHSVYLQIVYETGLIGAIVFLGWLFIQARQTLFCLRTLSIQEKWLLPAFLAIPLGIGLFESGPMLGASSLALFWGFAVGMADRLPEISHAAEYQPQTWEDELLAAAAAHRLAIQQHPAYYE